MNRTFKIWVIFIASFIAIFLFNGTLKHFVQGTPVLDVNLPSIVIRILVAWLITVYIFKRFQE